MIRLWVVRPALGGMIHPQVVHDPVEGGAPGVRGHDPPTGGA